MDPNSAARRRADADGGRGRRCLLRCGEETRPFDQLGVAFELVEEGIPVVAGVGWGGGEAGCSGAAELGGAPAGSR